MQIFVFLLFVHCVVLSKKGDRAFFFHTDAGKGDISQDAFRYSFLLSVF